MGPIILSRSFADCRKRAPKRATGTKMGTPQVGSPREGRIFDRSFNLFFNGRGGERAGAHTRGASLRICVLADTLLVSRRMDSLNRNACLSLSNLIAFDENKFSVPRHCRFTRGQP